MTLSGGPSASRDGVSAVAGLDEEDDMKAEGPARNGKRAVDGLAVDGKLLAYGVADAPWAIVESYLAKRTLPSTS